MTLVSTPLRIWRALRNIGKHVFYIFLALVDVANISQIAQQSTCINAQKATVFFLAKHHG